MCDLLIFLQVSLQMPPSGQLSPLATPAAYRAVAKNIVNVARSPSDYIYVSVSTETLVLEVRCRIHLSIR